MNQSFSDETGHFFVLTCIDNTRKLLKCMHLVCNFIQLQVTVKVSHQSISHGRYVFPSVMRVVLNHPGKMTFQLN